MIRKQRRAAGRATPQDRPQQSTGRSIARDETKKRIVKQHPQRDLPRVEGVEPRDAPTKE